jgi:hypothetical protein
MTVAPHVSLQGTWPLSEGLELSIREDKDVVRTMIKIGTATLTLPKNCHTLQIQTNNGVAAILLGTDLESIGYGDIAVLVCKADKGGVQFSYCAREKSIRLLFNTYCYINKILSVDGDGTVQIEVAYQERARPPHCGVSQDYMVEF